jgi:hypothetical protein
VGDSGEKGREVMLEIDLKIEVGQFYFAARFQHFSPTKGARSFYYRIDRDLFPEITLGTFLNRVCKQAQKAMNE